MLQIRRNVFETNSSSTHSITITKPIREKAKRIPRNYKHLYMVSEIGEVCGGECEYALNSFFDEVDKLRFVVNMIATVYDHSRYYNNNEYKKDFETLINKELFVWLKEVVREETGTEITFERPYSEYYPYFDTVYSEYDEIEDLLALEMNSGEYDKEKFKNRIKEIIFDKDIAVYNENCPYGMEEASVRRKI